MLSSARCGRAVFVALLSLVLVACQTATLLQDGRVLLVSPFGSQVYDPVAGTLTTTGGPTEMRMLATDTLLPDGRVLIIGGAKQDGLLDTVEAWDPATGTFTDVGTLLEGRGLHSATLLPDGTVLVAGGGTVSSGQADTPPPLRTAERFDAVRGASSATGAMTDGRAMHTATALDDGTVVVIGGISGDRALATAERYDPATGSFTPAGELLDARAFHTATRMDDGTVLVIGGMSSGATEDAEPDLVGAVERYDPAAGSFTRIGDLAVPRAGHTATLLPDGRVLVVGGVDTSEGESSAGGIASAELFDPATGTSAPTGDLLTPRGLHAAVLLPTGDVLVAGGDLDGMLEEPPPAGPELWSAATGTFSAVGG